MIAPRLRSGTRFPGTVLLAVCLSALPAPLFAAKVQLGDSSGSTPVPVEGSDLMVSFNPTVVVQTQAGESAFSLLFRLAAGINEAGQGIYTSEASVPAALEIRRTTGGDIDDLRFGEDDARIQSLVLTLQRPKLSAWIGVVQQTPTEGVIVLTLDDRIITVETGGLGSADAVNLALVEATRQAGFEVAFFPPFIVVLRYSGSSQGLTRLGWRSTDPGITLADLALLPEAGTGSVDGTGSQDATGASPTEKPRSKS
jgi:hypothetical protein